VAFDGWLATEATTVELSDAVVCELAEGCFVCAGTDSDTAAIDTDGGANCSWIRGAGSVGRSNWIEPNPNPKLAAEPTVELLDGILNELALGCGHDDSILAGAAIGTGGRGNCGCSDGGRPNGFGAGGCSGGYGNCQFVCSPITAVGGKL